MIYFCLKLRYFTIFGALKFLNPKKSAHHQGFGSKMRKCIIDTYQIPFYVYHDTYCMTWNEWYGTLLSLFLLISTLDANVTLNLIFYYSHTLVLRMLPVWVLYIVWWLTLYHFSITYWTLWKFNCFNIVPMLFNDNQSWLSYSSDTHCKWSDKKAQSEQKNSKYRYK